jgi:hypothetical protein
MPVFGIDLLGQLHGFFNIRKKHGYLFAFSLQRAAGGQNLVGQILGRVCTGYWAASDCVAGRLTTPVAEFGIRWIFSLTVGADAMELQSALLTELRFLRVPAPARGAAYPAIIGLVANHDCHPNASLFGDTEPHTQAFFNL